jgi:hypothetical protein
MRLFRHAGPDPASRLVPTKVGNHLKYWIPVFTGNPGCAHSLRLAPPPFGRPAGVYPVLDTGPE